MHRGDHPAYLVFLALGECDRERLRSGLAHGAVLGQVALDVDSRLHRFFKAIAERLGNAHAIFFVVVVARVEEAIGHAAVVRKDDETA